jgi:FkbM family methyltransferase
VTSILSKCVGRINRIFAGKERYQNYYEILYSLSLQGMNIGQGSRVDSSGEVCVLTCIKNLKAMNYPVTIFDVGANVGDFACAVQEVMGDSANIFGFEPKKSTFETLQKRISEYNNIKIFNFGFGDKKGNRILFFDSDPEKSGIASIYPRRLDHFNISLSCQETINLTTVDDFCCENRITHIDLLKMDVEGHELMVLKGATKMIEAESIDCILFEFGGCNIDSRTYFQDFFYVMKDRYNIYRILQDGLYPINEYNEKYEIFLTTNFFAVRKQFLEKRGKSRSEVF